MIEHKSRQNKKRKCLKIDNLLKKNRIEVQGPLYLVTIVSIFGNKNAKFWRTQAHGDGAIGRSTSGADNEPDSQRLQGTGRVGSAPRRPETSLHRMLRHQMLRNEERLLSTHFDCKPGHFPAKHKGDYLKTSFHHSLSMFLHVLH